MPSLAHRRRSSLWMLAALAVPGVALAEPAVQRSRADASRVDGLTGRPPDGILVFVVRGDGVAESVSAFHEAARATIEAHLHARVVSMEEAFVGGDLQRQLALCHGEDGCYARLAGPSEAAYLLVITASKVADLVLVGARFLDLAEGRAVGNVIDPLGPDQRVLDVLPDRIKAAVPEPLWEPFGRLLVTVDQAGAEVSVNGRLVGVAPLPAIGGLMPGRYAIAARLGGFEVAEAETDIERGREARVELHLETQSSAVSWIWWALGAAALAGGAVAVAVAASSPGAPTFCSAPPGGCVR